MAYRANPSGKSGQGDILMNDIDFGLCLFGLAAVFFGFAALCGIEQIVKWWRER
jgi:hypothetical protein